MPWFCLCLVIHVVEECGPPPYVGHAIARIDTRSRSVEIACNKGYRHHTGTSSIVYYCTTDEWDPFDQCRSTSSIFKLFVVTYSSHTITFVIGCPVCLFVCLLIAPVLVNVQLWSIIDH